MTAEWVVFNGALVEVSHLKLSLHNRAFKYGDGLFETIRMFNGELPFWELHFSRLTESLAQLGLPAGELYSDKLYARIIELANAERLSNARVRLTAWRDAAGAYLPESNELAYLIEIHPLLEAELTVSDIGLTVGLYDKDKKYPGPLANVKTCNAQLYVQAARYAKEKGWDDAFILNTKDQIIEATASNLFLVKGTGIHTPPLSQGPVAGVMRQAVLQTALEQGWQVSAGTVTKQTLQQADEVWLTNAVKGIQWVGEFGSKTYDNNMALRFMDLLTRKWF